MATWLETIRSQINSVGFESISSSDIQKTFDSLKSEFHFSLTKSGYNVLVWKVEGARNYLLDTSAFAIKDLDGNTISDFGTYDETAITFTTVDERSGSYYIVGEWLNKYKLLSALWNIRVESRVRYVNTNVRGVSVRLQQEFDHCIKMRDHYNNKIIRQLSW